MFNIALLIALLSIPFMLLDSPATDEAVIATTVDVLAVPVNSTDSEMVDVAPGLPLMAPARGMGGTFGPMGGHGGRSVRHTMMTYAEV